MLRNVSVYSVRDQADDHHSRADELTVQMTLVGHAVVAGIDSNGGDRRLAAEGWCKLVGIPRRCYLKKLRAPQQVVSGIANVNVLLRADAYMGSIRRAPSGISAGNPLSEWIYDNGVESWLIVVLPLNK